MEAKPLIGLKNPPTVVFEISGGVGGLVDVRQEAAAPVGKIIVPFVCRDTPKGGGVPRMRSLCNKTV
jgi:hypothetical protein